MSESKVSKDLRPYTYALPDTYWKLPIVSSGGPGKMPDYEKVISVRPDVIFAATFSKVQLDMIQRSTRVPVIGLSYGGVGHTNLSAVKDSIRNIAYIIDNQKRSQDLFNYIAMLRKELCEKTLNVDPKEVFMAAIAYKGPREINSTERDHPALEMMSLINVADSLDVDSGMGTHVMVQPETILKWQPEYIFYDITGLKILNKQYYKSFPFLSKLDAVKNKKVFTVMPYNWYNSNLENTFATAYYIGKVLYPEKFKDIDMDQKIDDIMNNFIGINPFPEIKKKHDVFRRIDFEKSGFVFSD
jgi:iron complex transport system substrate-binding protein